jgi:hypothetical protein
MVHLDNGFAKLPLASMVELKFFYFMLALLIIGKQSVTPNVFDVYMEPLVEEL